MFISRRQFLNYCTASASILGLGAERLGMLRKVMAESSSPSIIWLIGSACTGCSISLLNRISDQSGEPSTITDLLTGGAGLVFHPTLMSAAGESAAAQLQEAYRRGNFILVLEGAIPTGFNGNACVVYTLNGREVTFLQAVQELSPRASKVICVGTCAAFGGIPASGVNPTQAMGFKDYTGRPVINVSGCPANPDWVFWTLVRILIGAQINLDADNRPVDLYRLSFDGKTEAEIIHDKCPRNPNQTGKSVAIQLGENGLCLESVGCRGPFTKSRCQAAWNGIGGNAYPEAHPGHWCIGVNAPCHGCVEKTFPGSQPFYEAYTPPE